MRINYEISSWMGTVAFVFCGFLAISFETLEIVYVVFSLCIFCIGLALSAIAFLKSLELSRHQIVTTSDLFLLSVSFPKRSRVALWASFTANLIAGILLLGYVFLSRNDFVQTSLLRFLSFLQRVSKIQFPCKNGS